MKVIFLFPSRRQWIDTFGFDDVGHLLFVSNKLLMWVSGTMKFDGSDGANFRI